MKSNRIEWKMSRQEENKEKKLFLYRPQMYNSNYGDKNGSEIEGISYRIRSLFIWLKPPIKANSTDGVVGRVDGTFHTQSSHADHTLCVRLEVD